MRVVSSHPAPSKKVNKHISQDRLFLWRNIPVIWCISLSTQIRTIKPFLLVESRHHEYGVREMNSRVTTLRYPGEEVTEKTNIKHIWYQCQHRLNTLLQSNTSCHLMNQEEMINETLNLEKHTQIFTLNHLWRRWVRHVEDTSRPEKGMFSSCLTARSDTHHYRDRQSWKSTKQRGTGRQERAGDSGEEREWGFCRDLWTLRK